MPPHRRDHGRSLGNAGIVNSRLATGVKDMTTPLPLPSPLAAWHRPQGLRSRQKARHTSAAPAGGHPRALAAVQAPIVREYGYSALLARQDAKERDLTHHPPGGAHSPANPARWELGRRQGTQENRQRPLRWHRRFGNAGQGHLLDPGQIRFLAASRRSPASGKVASWSHGRTAAAWEVRT